MLFTIPGLKRKNSTRVVLGSFSKKLENGGEAGDHYDRENEGTCHAKLRTQLLLPYWTAKDQIPEIMLTKR